jgi:hypothetical protein
VILGSDRAVVVVVIVIVIMVMARAVAMITVQWLELGVTRFALGHGSECSSDTTINPVRSAEVCCCEVQGKASLSSEPKRTTR